jgi:magnesium transporter
VRTPLGGPGARVEGEDPLTFATGFFGMNFGWLVNHIDSPSPSSCSAWGGMIVPLIVAAVLLLRTGYLQRR